MARPIVTQIAQRYDLIRELGRGGMATVFLARQLDLDRLVALKELGALRTSDPSFAQRFLREAQLAGSFSHPNIVTVHDYFSYGDVPYIAMEFLERGSLRPYVGSMSLAQIGGVLEAVLSGLVRAEKDGIVHRDLKPENLLVTAEGSVKISDFGIAKATNALQTGAGMALTSTGMAIGTPNYMAPEQALAQGVGPWTDLYSVGIMAFEFLTGRPPFGDTPQAMAVLLRQVNDEIPPVTELDASVDADLSNWVAHMVAKEPTERPRSAAVAADELEEILIASLGPRWRRESLLAPQRQPDLDPALPLALAGETFRDRTTFPLAGPEGAATVPPSLPAPQPVAGGATVRKPRRRARTVAKLTVAGLAVVAALAAVIVRGGDSPLPAAGVGTTTTPEGSIVDALPQERANGTGSNAADLANERTAANRLAQQYETAATRVARLKGARVAGSPTASLRDALLQTAGAYRAAAAAAVAGDLAGYTAAMQDAAAGKKSVNVALAAMRAAARAPVTGSSPSEPAQSSPPPVQSTSCSGDSVSDDPSDEDCGSP